MSRPTWFIDLIKKTFPGRFRFAALTKVPIIGRAVDRALFAGDDIIYLPKDNVIPIGRAIPGPESLVLPSQIVEHFIEQAAYHWIMNFCICRDASACRDYPIALGCLFLGEAVLEINPQHGHLVSKEEALAHARRCREAGLVHLIGRNKLDTVWLGIGPSNKLMTICNCCPCCCLWRMLPQIDPAIGHKVQSSAGHQRDRHRALRGLRDVRQRISASWMPFAWSMVERRSAMRVEAAAAASRSARPVRLSWPSQTSASSIPLLPG